MQIQRFNAFGQWVTLKRVKLNSSGAQRFKVALPKGLNRLRVAMSVNQAGAGFAGGFSKTILWRNR